MELQALLEEEKSIKSKIKSALNSISEWFNKKIELCRDKFDEMKSKIATSIKTTNSDLKLELKRGLTMIKNAFEDVIKICQKTIRYVMGIKDEDLQKEIVVEKIETEKATVAQGIAGITLVFMGLFTFGVKYNTAKGRLSPVPKFVPTEHIKHIKSSFKSAHTIYKRFV